jgi:regulator of sigma E protease
MHHACCDDLRHDCFGAQKTSGNAADDSGQSSFTYKKYSSHDDYFRALKYKMRTVSVGIAEHVDLDNIIPIPGLDGGKIFFIILKVISRGKIDDEMEYKATLVGMALILALFVLITFNDVKNLFG